MNWTREKAKVETAPAGVVRNKRLVMMAWMVRRRRRERIAMRMSSRSVRSVWNLVVLSGLMASVDDRKVEDGGRGGVPDLAWKK